MYCEKCGNELKDNEIICTKCGCTINYNENRSYATEDYSSLIADSRIKTLDDLERDIKVCKTLAILAVIFCLGIGIIFTFLFAIKLRKILNTEYKDITNSTFIVNQKLKKYIKLSVIPAVVIFAVMLFSPIIINILN